MKIMLSCLHHCIVIAFFSILFSTANILFSQAPTTGFEIESILVDGCDGGNEGKNEMVVFRNGPIALDINSIRIDGAGSSGIIVNSNWPSGNNFLGFCTTAGASTNIANLDAAIIKCGRLLEPPAGIIPPNKKVLIMTSTDFTFVPTYFANLTDTLYVVLQCAGNVSGHFVNYNSTSSFRTLVLTNTVTGYADTVLYDRSLLLNSSGTPGAGDGGAVAYSWSGIASYFNNGCQAPFIPISVGYAPVGAADCTTNTFSLSGNVMSGSYKEIFWTGGTGTFSASNSLNTDYVPGVGELGNDTLIFHAVDFCDDTTSIEIPIFIYPLPVADAGGDISICSGIAGSLGTTTNLDFSYSWSPLTGLTPDGTVSNPNVTLTNTSSIPVTSIYTVTTTVVGTGCSISNDVNVTVTALDTASFTTNPTCDGGTSVITGTIGGTFTFTSAPSDGAIINSSTGEITGGAFGTTYFITYTTGGTCSVSSNGSVTALNQENTSFTTSPTCDGGTSTITGTLGGAFTFTSAPSDAAIINSSTGEVTGGTNGSTYFITYSTAGTCSTPTNGNVTALSQDVTTFTTTPTCDGGTSNITGTTGGTFTFTTVPSDAAIVNGSTGEVTNGTSGTTYFITYSTTGACSTPTNESVTALNQDFTTFLTTPTCDGGTSIITGTPGGTFLFTTIPSDAAILNTATGEITGGTFGTTYLITYSTSGLCSTPSNGTVTALFQDPSFTITPNCSGATISNIASPNGNFSFYTSPIDGADINSLDGTITGGTSGTTYTITYETNICTNSLTQDVTIPTTSSAPSASNDTSYCSNETKIDLTAIPSNGGNITWYSDSMLTTILGTGNTLPIINANGTGLYYVTETEFLFGCEGESKTIRITINECDITIPTAFTPNGDNIDDVWELKNLDIIFPDNIVRIYNRWGNLIFESSKGMYEKFPWDGNFSGSALPLNAYYFVIDYNTNDKVNDTGTVCILK